MKFNYFSFPSNLQILEIDILKLHVFGSISCHFSIWMSLNIIMKTSLRGFKAKNHRKTHSCFMGEHYILKVDNIQNDFPFLSVV